MKNILVFSILLMLIGPVKAQERQVSHRVVFQMTSSSVEEQKGLINNVNNLLNLWKGDVVIHVVIHGPGISLVQSEKTTLQSELYLLVEKGVVFQVCENTLKQKGIAKEAIIDKMEYVPSGIAEIIQKQEQGWSYIKSNF